MAKRFVGSKEFVHNIDIACAEIDLLLETPLSDEPEMIKHQMEQAESYHNRIATLLTQAEEFFRVARLEVLPEIERPKDEFGRKIKVEAESARNEYYVNILKRKLDSIELRIQTGQSVLAYYRENVKRLG